MKNKIIQSFWSGKELSNMEIMCIKSYQNAGHEFHLYTYEDVLKIPGGTILKDASEIVPYKEIFIDSFKGYVNFSNFFHCL